jgi:hypothetical protein
MVKRIKSLIIAVISVAFLLGVIPAGAQATYYEGIGNVTPSTLDYYVNKEKVNVASYLINGNTFLKLRDIGRALDISVEWAADTQAVHIDTSKPYPRSQNVAETVVAETIRSIKINKSEIYIDGNQISFTVYLINDSNYFRLRDIGQSLDIGIEWDEASRSVLIDTSVPYAPVTLDTLDTLDTPGEPDTFTPGPDVPVRELISDDFFADAAIIGHSLVEGLRLYSGLITCDYIAATSLSVFDVGTLKAIKLKNGSIGTVYQAVGQETYGKVYILLGINEIEARTSDFRNAYARMLDKIAEIQPGADIYIMSLTPVTAKKSSSGVFTMSRITDYNAALYELAAEKGCYYIDLIEALADESGYLPESASWDGVHFNAGYYKVWADYLRTHYVINP